jgi:hypothetical protein
MPCGETVAVCCENLTEHTDTLWAVRTSQETHNVSGTERNRLMLCGETVAVCCENSTEHTDITVGRMNTFLSVKAGGTYRNHWALNINEQPR